MALSDGVKRIYELITSAAANGTLGIVEATNNDTGKLCPLLCAIIEENGQYEIYPFAVVAEDIRDLMATYKIDTGDNKDGQQENRDSPERSH